MGLDSLRRVYCYCVFCLMGIRGPILASESTVLPDGSNTSVASIAEKTAPTKTIFPKEIEEPTKKKLLKLLRNRIASDADAAKEFLNISKKMENDTWEKLVNHCKIEKNKEDKFKKINQAIIQAIKEENVEELAKILDQYIGGKWRQVMQKMKATGDKTALDKYKAKYNFTRFEVRCHDMQKKCPWLDQAIIQGNIRIVALFVLYDAFVANTEKPNNSAECMKTFLRVYDHLVKLAFNNDHPDIYKFLKNFFKNSDPEIKEIGEIYPYCGTDNAPQKNIDMAKKLIDKLSDNSLPEQVRAMYH